MAIHVINEARRCLQCKKPLCRLKGCPAQTNIPEMIRLFLNGNINEAGEMLFANNPMSVVCSLVCDHEKQCEGNCIQGRKGAPVQISSIEHYISDIYLDKVIMEHEPPKGQNVAVIGSGPAGITVSVKLAQLGYDVTIFERKGKLGGMMRYGIPSFRLPLEILDRYQEKLVELGIHIRPNTTIGSILTLDTLFQDGYDAVFIGSGVWRPRGLGVRGESLGNCHYAVDYLQNPDVYHLGDRVAVIGSGEYALHEAQVLQPHAGKVMLLTNGEPLQVPVPDAIEVRTQKLAAVEGGDRVTGVRFEDGTELPLDGIFLAIGTAGSSELARKIGAMLDGTDVKVDAQQATNVPGLFAAGDCTGGLLQVAKAVHEGAVAGLSALRYVRAKRSSK